MLMNMAMLVFMQVCYFMSQSYDCMTVAPKVYFWTMGQILMVYMGITVVICHFFRKHC